MKKFVSLSLSFVMMITAMFGFAVTSFADQTFVCGDKITANFNKETGTLTLSGTGDMFDYTAGSAPEWTKVYMYKVESVVINEGITSVGNWAFANMNYLTTVSFPSTLKSIGERAFSSCKLLTGITIPVSVESIGDFALKTTSDDIVSSLQYINVEEGNKNYSSVDGVLYNKDQTVLIQIPARVDITTLVLPETVETINSYAGHQARNIQEIVIPRGIKNIQPGAFDNCSKLEYVSFNTDDVFNASTDFISNTSAVIRGYAGSYTQTFAQENGFTFEAFPYCLLKFVDNKGQVTEVTQDIGTLPQDIDAPSLPNATYVNDNQHMAYSWSPALKTVTVNATYTVSGSLENHSYVELPDTYVKATIDNAGKYADKQCTVCGNIVEGKEIPQLEHYTVTATAENGTAEVQGVSPKNNVAVNGDITLVATPASEDLEFVGWSLNGKIVSTDTTYATKAISDAQYVAIFAEAKATEFTVVFTDQYGNVYSSQTVTDASQIEIPEAPEFVGFTFKGWSMTEEEIKALTTNATITANFERTADDQYTVTVPEGCTIDGVDGNTTTVDYNTKVTVNAPEGAVNGTWKVNDAPVAYGTSYSFFVGADITLTYEENAAVTAEPAVAAVSTDRDADSYKVAFLATRSLADGYDYIYAGFVFGMNMEDADLNINNEGEKGSNPDSGYVKVLYCSTDSEQFRLSYGITNEKGKASARAFLAYVDSTGETHIEYGEPQVYNY